MKITKATITGADNKVEVKTLLDLNERFPFVEWGVLFASKLGRERYPDEGWKQTATKTLDNLSAHLCGKWSRGVLERKDFDIISQLSPSYKRVQLNYNFKYSKGWNLEALLGYAMIHNERSIILQYNKSNSFILDRYKNHMPKNVQLLYDTSGGRGTEIKSIEPPLGISHTGYAGGLNTTNIEQICELITDQKNNSECWIDLESGVRTEDQFDFNKVLHILRKVEKFI